MNIEYNNISSSNLSNSNNVIVDYISKNKNISLLFVVILIIWGFIFSILGSNKEDTSISNENGLSKMLTIILFAFLIVLIIFNSVTYFYNIDFQAEITKMNPENTEITFDVDLNKASSKKLKKLFNRKEVYHVHDNLYNYENSKAICKAYGGRLANYNDLEKAYKKGANWCSYGWSDNQMALFPTQKKTYEELQKIPGHENDCGRPGINGGYIDNPNVRFGVNCYGIKPEISPEEATAMKNMTIYPKTVEDKMFEERVDFWKSKIPEIILSPFNTNTWSRF